MRLMTTREMTDRLELTAASTLHEVELTGALVADLLSDVLANGAPGYVWITIQTHRNVAAVASAQSLAAIIITAGRQPGDELLELAEAEQVSVLTSPESSFTVAGRLYELGLR